MTSIRTNIAPSWQEGLAGRPAAILLMPYVTGRTATEIADALGSAGTLVTRLDLLDFVSGASSIDALLAVQKAGMEIRALPDLHAKLFVTAETTTIGSQNLTARGTRNKEMSILVQAVDDREAVRDIAEAWVEEARAVGRAEIEEIARRVRLLAPAWEQLKDRADVEEEALETWRKREAEERRRRSRSRVSEIKRTALSSASSVRVVFEPNRTPPAGGVDDLILTRADSDASFLDWKMKDGSTYRLRNRARYPVIEATSGQIRFARISKTRINFFEKTFRWGASISDRAVEGSYWLTPRFAPQTPSDEKADIILTLHAGRGSILHPDYQFDIAATFGQGGLKILRMTPTVRCRKGPRPGWLNDRSAVAEKIFDDLTSPRRPSTDVYRGIKGGAWFREEIVAANRHLFSENGRLKGAAKRIARPRKKVSVHAFSDRHAVLLIE